MSKFNLFDEKPQDVVPLPARMHWLPKDARGYPIPYNIQRDKNGKPHFTINDHEKALKCFAELRCPICGNELLDDILKPEQGMWFIGGPLSALSKHGAYVDQPVHKECGQYALQVCPYLAAPHYGKRIDAKTMKPEDVPEEVFGFMDPTVIADRPSFFVAVHAISYTMYVDRYPNITLRPTKPYIDMEFWLNGEQISKKQALELLKLKKEASHG